MDAVSQRIAIGSISLSNRIGLAPINSGFANHTIENDMKAAQFYSQYAHNGVGLVFIGGIAVSDSGRSNSGSYVATSDRFLKLAERTLDLFHDTETHLAIQLMHAGDQMDEGQTGGHRISASAFSSFFSTPPKVAAIEEINNIKNDFIHSAEKLQRVGVRIIEIHAAHGYFISSFISALSNSRRDIYGMSIRNRFRLLEEILIGTKNVFHGVIGIRINVNEHGANVDLGDIVKGLAPLSSLYDYLSISAGTYSKNLSHDFIIPRRSLGEALWTEQSKILKQTIKKPVLIAGNISSRETISIILNNRQADIVLLGRSLLANPYFFSKEASCKNINLCVEDYCCKYHMHGYSSIFCPQNLFLRENYPLRQL